MSQQQRKQEEANNEERQVEKQQTDKEEKAESQCVRNNNDELKQMQLDYQLYFLGKSAKKAKEKIVYPIEKYSHHKLHLCGGSQGRILLKVQSLQIEPSSTSLDLQNEAVREKDVFKNRAIDRFWEKRFILFEKYSEGIKLDEESWYSVTPQAVAKYIAARIGNYELTVLDGFCGAGGDSIQLALACKSVFANDIDPKKLELLANNSKIYNADNITPSCQNFLYLTLKDQIDLVYMSPPWGGTQYYEQTALLPSAMTPPLDDILKKSFGISQNVVLLLPANIHIEALAQEFAQNLRKEHTSSCTIVIEKLYFQQRLKFLLVLFGSKAAKVDPSDELCYIYGIISDKKGPFPHKKLVKAAKDKLGMIGLLNSLFECQGYLWRNHKTIKEKLEAYLVHFGHFSQEELLKIEESDKAQLQFKDKRQALRVKIVEKAQKNEDKKNGEECQNAYD